MRLALSRNTIPIWLEESASRKQVLNYNFVLIQICSPFTAPLILFLLRYFNIGNCGLGMRSAKVRSVGALGTSPFV